MERATQVAPLAAGRKSGLNGGGRGIVGAVCGGPKEKNHRGAGTQRRKRLIAGRGCAVECEALGFAVKPAVLPPRA